MEKSYATARMVLGFVVFAGWTGLVVGIICALIAISGYQTDSLLLLTGISLVAASLILVATSQVSFAILDQADYSRATFRLISSFAEAQGIQPSTMKDASRDATVESSNAQSPTVREDGAEVRVYLGHEITSKNGKHYVAGNEYRTLGKAKTAIK